MTSINSSLQASAVLARCVALLIVAAWPAFAPVVAQAQDSLTLTVIVTGAEPDTGQALAAVFNSKSTWLKEPVASEVVPIDSDGTATIVFDGLSAGVIAVSVIFDEDSDGELDTGFLGIPTEMVAMSRNAKARFGPPKYRKARFELLEDQTIMLRFGKAID